MGDSGEKGWMVEEISGRGGAISFHDFMDLALYHPGHGYYSSGLPRHGPDGDYLTAPSASPWYAAVFFRLLTGLAKILGPVTVVDVASGSGAFPEQVLDRASPAGVLRGIVSVERSSAMRDRQRTRLAGAAVPVKVLADISELSPIEGMVVVHASELYDALPVHRVVARASGLAELWVAAVGGELKWQEVPADPSLAAYFDLHEVELAVDQLAEINLSASKVHASLLGRMGPSALCVVLDYGYEAGRLYNPRGRAGGSLACYRDHRLSRDPLLWPGEQDITAHINWGDLRLAAASSGWSEVGLWSLTEFLIRAGLAAEIEDCGLGIAAELSAETYGQRQEIKRLLDPEGMGSDLKVLVQGKGQATRWCQELLAISC